MLEVYCKIPLSTIIKLVKRLAISKIRTAELASAEETKALAVACDSSSKAAGLSSASLRAETKIST